MIRLRSKMEGNVVGIDLVFDDDSWMTVAMVMMPDRDFRATVEFYDDLAKAYKKRLTSWTNQKIK